MRLSEIAEVFGLASYASAGSTIQKLKRSIIGDKKLGIDINYILLDLTPLLTLLIAQICVEVLECLGKTLLHKMEDIVNNRSGGL